MVRKVVLCALVLLVMGSCDSGSAILLDADADGATVTVPVGGIVEIVLAANPSTGFTWEVVGLDETVVRQTGEATFEAESTLVGASGEMRFMFETLSTGTTAIELVYHRTFETVDPADTFTVTLIVEE
jgi:inhibitor of cysteine peptidase